jgi:UDP-glucose 4-epimerase
MVKAFEKIVDKSLNITLGERRLGDVVEIYANYDKAKEKLGWIPKYDIGDIMRTAWNWKMKTL